MANQWYDKGVEKFAAGQCTWGIGSAGDTIKAVGVSASYAFSQAHEFLADVPSLARVCTSPALTGKSYTAGVLDADDALFTAVTGAQVIAAVVYKDTGNAATSPLLFYIDSMTGLPFTPSGADELITWPNDAGKIAVL
ncbi:hypothetical protein BTO20_11530 [Mycobacterium dioxanotrophicus]|uniref:Head decoration protein n=1 Tax=Mycobacterium dioxanotrophicus TaxID=482462 RepID=A0A1Y0C1U8_9MYCO|nr:hypothetical protein [Mycobacterium dioxanotrophicus]ART69128.1 hypothetical protein BTO20_11530 [Mycobacterium dioxanotrophicus]